MITIPTRSLEVIGRNVVAIKEQCNALLALLADLQDGIAAADVTADDEVDRESQAATRPDAPAGAPTPRVLNRGDIRTRLDGSRIIRPTFGKPAGEPVVKVTTNVDDARAASAGETFTEEMKQ